MKRSCQSRQYQESLLGGTHLGTPPPRLDMTWISPQLGTLPGAGVPLLGYPLAWETPPAGVPPGFTCLGVPPWLDMAGEHPLCRQTDRHVSKHNLPVVLRTRSVTTLWKCDCSAACWKYHRNGQIQGETGDAHHSVHFFIYIHPGSTSDRI